MPKHPLPLILGLLLTAFALAQPAASSLRLSEYPGYEYACVCEVLEETKDTRLVRHATGETRIPLDPQRIVTLDQYFTDMLLSPGVTPVAPATYSCLTLLASSSARYSATPRGGVRTAALTMVPV